MRVSNVLLLAAALSCAALAGCAQSDSSAFHSSFRSSFTKSFVASCEARAGGTAQAKAYCICAEAGVAKKYSDSQLMAIYRGTASQADKDAMRAIFVNCAAKARAGKNPT